MRGKPLDQITNEDIDQLISDGLVEDNRMEFKQDLSVSREVRQSKGRDYVERTWMEGRSLTDFARDALAEEIVAFANSDGGTLVLGIEESEDNPPRAAAVNLLPGVADLERRIRDVLVDCVEPRLPYVAVRGVPLTDDGSGVVVIETSASISAPHWVKKTRKPSVRRGDRCDTMTMAEVQDMVLRRGRSREKAVQQQVSEREAFAAKFKLNLQQRLPDEFANFSNGIGVELWLQRVERSALGLQVVLTPHSDLGIPRLETLQGLLPASDAIGLSMNDTVRPMQWLEIFNFAAHQGARCLGGVVSRQPGDFDKSVKVMRDGRVTVSFIDVRNTALCTCTADLVVAAAGTALGIYDRLRAMSTYPAAPADLTLDIHTVRHVGVGHYEGSGMGGNYGRLAPHEAFPSYVVGATEDFALAMKEIAADLLNAGGITSGGLNDIVWNDLR